MTVDARRIAIIGAGKIGESLLAGLVASRWRTPEELVATVRQPAHVDDLAERYGVSVTTSNPEAVAGAGLVVIAVKQQDMAALPAEIGPPLTAGQTVLSVAPAGAAPENQGP